jgi:flagellum-specific ATP synthase
MINLDKYIHSVAAVDPCEVSGRVSQVVGLVVEALGPEMAVGDLCHIIDESAGTPPVAAEVVGFRNNRVLLMPLGELRGVSPGSRILAQGRSLAVRVGNELLGRVLDGFGQPIDGKGPVLGGTWNPIYQSPPGPLERRRITGILSTGITSLDALLTCGVGQRLGIFSGSGVGKSTMMGMIARHTSADVNVIGLIGERGREVKDFLEKDLGPEGLKRSVVVVATSDQPALVRRQGAFVATAIAEYFRDQGQNVILMIDSITRFCTAQREVGLAIGEPPTTRGYTPSVFALLPKLLERSGALEGAGSITGLYTVLVEADDMNDPIGDSVRSILDGHLVLSRELATQNHYPAIEVLESVSRLTRDLLTPSQLELAACAREHLAIYRKNQDLINIGAYPAGSNPVIDEAIRLHEPLRQFLRQPVDQGMTASKSWSLLAGTLAPPAAPRQVSAAPARPARDGGTL